MQEHFIIRKTKNNDCISGNMARLDEKAAHPDKGKATEH